MSPVGPGSEESLAEEFARLAEQWPDWAGVRDRLRRSGLEPTQALELRTKDTRGSWRVLAEPSAALKAQFELAPEVLVLCTPWKTVQANDIARVEDFFRTSRRADPGFVVVIAQDRDAEARLGPVVPENRRYLFISADDFWTAPDPQDFMRRVLRYGLGGRRLFDLRRPAAGPQFFGRETEFEAIERDLLQGHCIGVYGLRKVGKTSLLGRLAEKYRDVGASARRVLPIEVDLLATDFNRRNLAAVLDLVREGLDRELARSDVRIQGLSEDPLRRLVAVIEYSERVLRARVVLILDEYEALLGARIPISDGLDLLTWLRGTAQRHPGSFSFVLAGRDATRLAPARIGDTDNPMYRFLRSFPLAGLSPEDSRTMMRKIGRRMALRFEHDALDILVRETGGHPALLRTLGDIIDAQVPLEERVPAVVDSMSVMRSMPRFSREVADDMRELVHVATDLDCDAGDYLTHLAHGVPWTGDAREALLDDALTRYGILQRDPRTFRIGHFATWLRENYAPPAKAAHG